MSGSPSDRLCICDPSGNPQPLMAMALPTGVFCGASSCWKNSKSGFGYRNEAGTPRGLTTVMRAGAAGRAQVEAQGTECRQTTYAMATVDVSSELSAKEP